MKDIYEKPIAEKIAFSYQEQVVAQSGGSHYCQGSRGENYDECRDDVQWQN